MKFLPTLVTLLLAGSLVATVAPGQQPAKAAVSKPSPGAPGAPKGGKGKPETKPDRDHGPKNPKDCDDNPHGPGNPKPPKPPQPPKDCFQTPAAPTQLSAAAVSEFQVNLSWTDNSSNELGFKIERSLDGTNYVQIAQVLPNTTVYRDLNRFPDTKYFYRARAFNAQGNSAYSNVARTQHMPFSATWIG